jgi:ribosome-associated heat shock protein Hsp15
MSKNKENIHESMRLDKWLWCARFYKTRSLAASAIKEGKIRIDGSKVKPARLVQIDDKIEIRRKPYQYEINVLNLAKSRSSASDAALLFHEPSESVKKREILLSQLKLASAAQDHNGSRPDKQQRRKIIRFTRGSGSP